MIPVGRGAWRRWLKVVGALAALTALAAVAIAATLWARRAARPPLDPLGTLGAGALLVSEGGGEGRVGEAVVSLETFEARAMGTLYAVTLPRTSEGRPSARQAAALAMAEVDRIERRISSWIPTSEVGRLNRANGLPVPISAETYWLLWESKRLSALTRGAFDITWAALKGAWDLRAGVVPAHDDLQARLKRVGSRLLHLSCEPRLLDPLRLSQPAEPSPRGHTLSALLGELPPRPLWLSELPSPHPLWAELSGHTTEASGCAARLEGGAQIDLGAIGKGYAIGSAARLLRRLGFEDFVVDGGGDLQVEGQSLSGEPWQVGVQHPRAEGVWATLSVPSGWSVVTSGDYERFFEREGARYHHIIDLRTGYPSTGVASLTLAARDPTVADALATALFILGPVAGLELAESLEGVEALWLISGGGVARTGGFERLSGPLPARWLPPPQPNPAPTDAPASGEIYRP